MEMNQDSSGNIDLVLRHLRGELSPLEEELFQNWLQKDKRNAELLAKLQNEEQLEKEIGFYSSIDTDKNWQQFLNKAKTQKPETAWWHWHKVGKYAAVLVVMLLSVMVLYKVASPRLKQGVIVQQTKPTMMDVAPGSDKAMLTLADGTKVALDETADGLVREFKGVKIIKQGDKVIYEFANNPDANAPIAYNTISTPRGGEYQLVLPDGTRVWLNAASSLRFPTAFASSERAVELEGEGYFEVAKRKNQPFKVVANNTTVEVLGTHFNLKAYKNEASSQTSLLEGSVKVGNGTTKTIIKPGEQAVVGASATIETLQADMEQVVAWKEGYFQFNEEDFTSVVAQLERWYDVDFNYPASLANKKFAGAIPRNSNLSQVLEMLELSGSITFKMEERRIMAIPQE